MRSSRHGRFRDSMTKLSSYAKKRTSIDARQSYAASTVTLSTMTKIRSIANAMILLLQRQVTSFKLVGVSLEEGYPFTPTSSMLLGHQAMQRIEHLKNHLKRAYSLQ